VKGQVRNIGVAIGLFLAWLPVAATRAEPPAPSAEVPGGSERAAEDAHTAGLKLSIVVDVREPGDGVAEVTMTVEGVSGSEGLFFATLALDKEVAVRGASFTDARGGAISFQRERRYWRLSPFAGDTVVARYQVKPGGMGRHGHQGWIGSDWASFDGRIFLMPEGVATAEDIRIRYEMPPGWVAATPFDVDGDWHRLNRFERRIDVEALQRSCVGLGPFRASKRDLGEMELRVYTPESFDTAWADQLHRDTARIGAWFHESFGFDLKAPYALVWLPRAADGERVWGGAWSNGACYEHDTPERHNWLLLGHRFAHPMNEYNPAGLSIGPDRDRWFDEGWAAYVEIVAAEATGVIEPATGFNALYKKYLQGVLRVHHEVPLSQHHVEDAELREFIHYQTAPLTVKILDDRMKARTGRGVEDFMAHLYAEHGWKRGAIDLREEVEAFTGQSWDAFWTTHVDRVSGIYPTWPGFADERIETRLAGKPMAFAGGSPVSATYVHFLGRTGDFASYAEVRDFVVTEGIRRARLRQHGVRLLPEPLHDKAWGLSPAIRYRLAKAERAYPVDDLPRPASRGCGAPSPPDLPPATFVPNLKKHPSAKIFVELLEREAAYEAEMGALAERIGINVGDGEALAGSHTQIAIRESDPLLGTAEWSGVPQHVTWEILRDGVVEQSGSMVHEPGWGSSWEKLEGERAKGEAILTLRVTADGERVGERPIWQR